MSVEISVALLPFLKPPDNGGDTGELLDLPDGCPPDLAQWLKQCNGLLLDDGTWLLGTGGHLEEILRIEVVFDRYPVFVDHDWWPVACDGFGNYWVLVDAGFVAFVDCVEDPSRLAHVVASSLDRFLIPFVVPFLHRNGWPFEPAVATSWDPSVLAVNEAKAWEA